MTDTEAEPKSESKGRPTPSRKEREAANKKPIVVADRHEARRIARAKDAEERAKVRAGIERGDERYFDVRDRGPVKRWVRDYVDARLSAGEFVIPLMFAVILLMYVPIEAVQAYITYALMGYFVLIILDAWLTSRLIQRKVDEKFGTRTEKVKWYAVMRMLQFRPMRMPKPQVKRFKFPE